MLLIGDLPLSIYELLISTLRLLDCFYYVPIVAAIVSVLTRCFFVGLGHRGSLL